MDHQQPLHSVDVFAIRWARWLHGFLARYGIYPVVLASLLCLGLFGLRAYHSRSWNFSFLFWNLALAWVPFVAAIAADTVGRGRRLAVLALVPALVSIAFFPNAPYILTDFLHLAHRPPVPVWFDIGLIGSFALTGIVLGAYALRILQDLVALHLGRLVSYGFAAVVLLLSGIGIYLGRFLRWNSWDLVMQPKAVLYDLWLRFGDPSAHPRTFVVCAVYSSVMLIFYAAITASPRAPSPAVAAHDAPSS